MTDFNRISRFSSGESNPAPIHRLADYFRHSFSEPFERAKATHRPQQVRISTGWTRARPGHRLPLTEEDLRIHAWLNERLAAIHYERHGLWPRANRLFRAIARFMLWPFVGKERFNTD
jgi:hypothetical protein